MILKLAVKSKANCDPIELPLSDSSHGIGRMHDNDLSIQNDCVSGYHAKLTRTPEGDYTVDDLDSSNGTFLNGTRISSPERVKAGDFLKFGNLKVAVEEHIESDSDSEENPLKIVSLKDLFSFEEEDVNSNTYPITPPGTPLIKRITKEVLKEAAGTEEPVPVFDKTKENEEVERAAKVKQVNAEPRKKQVNTSLEDVSPEIQSVTSDLDSALKEISRQKAINVQQLPMPAEIASQATGTAKEKQAIVRADEDTAALRSEISDLKDKLAESERKLLEDCQDKAQYLALSDELASHIAGAAMMRQEIVQAEDDNAVLRSKASDLTDKLAETERKLLENSQDNAQQPALSDEVAIQTAAAAKLKQEIVRGNEDNAALRSKVSDLTDKLAETERKLLDNSQDKAQQLALSDEVAIQTAAAAKLTQEVVQADEDNAALRSEIIDLNDKLAESERKLLETSQDKARAESETISQLQKQIAETESTSGNFEKIKETLTQSNLNLQQQLEDAKAAGQKSADREANLSRNNARLVEKLENAECNTAKLTVQIEEATSSLSENEKLIKKLQEQLVESESRSKSRSEAGRSLKANLDSMERMRLTAEAQVSQLQKKLASIETETQAVKEQLDTSEKNCAELEEELARSIKSRDESDSARDDLEEELARSIRTRDEFESARNHFEEELDRSIKARDEFKSARDHFEIQLNHRNSSIADLVESSEELEFRLKEADKEKAQIHTDLQLTREGLSAALHSTHRRLADASKNLNVEIYLREAAEKQLREAAAALESKRNGPEALALSSADTNLNRISDLMEEESNEPQTFEARLDALYSSEDTGSSGKDSKKNTAENGSFSDAEFYRQLLAKLDLVDSFTKLYENKWRYAKVAQQFALLKQAFLELLEDHSVSQFSLKPETSLSMNQKNRIDPVPLEDGMLPQINYSFGNSHVVETVCPGYIFRDGSREVIIRKAKVVVK